MNEEHRQFLEELRDSGEVNMWGAASYIEKEFELEPQEAKDILTDWIRSFDK